MLPSSYLKGSVPIHVVGAVRQHDVAEHIVLPPDLGRHVRVRVGADHEEHLEKHGR